MATVPAACGIVLPNHVHQVEFERVFSGVDSGVDLKVLNSLYQQMQAGLLHPNSEQSRLIGLLQEFDSNRAQSLSLVMAIGVFVAMLVQPVAGALSDRTHSRWGRRTPWLAVGAVLGAVVLTGLRFSTTIASIVALWALTLTAINVASAPLAATVADRVDASRVGRASLVTGLANVVGGIGGVVVAGAAFAFLGLNTYLTVAAVLLLGVLIFVCAARDNTGESAASKSHKSIGGGLPLRARLRDRDFRFAWAAKLLLMLATAVPSTFGIYTLQSYVRPAMSADEATKLVSVLALAALPLMVVSMVVAGRWSDRISRRKPFVFGSSLAIAGLALVPATSSTLPAFIASSLMTTAAVGVFLVVDQALFIDLLGNRSSAGRDLGLATLAGSVGQAVGPVVAGQILALNVGYGALWVVSAAIAFAAALAVLPVRRCR